MFFLLMQTFTAAAAQQWSDVVVRDGDEVTLPAECFRNMMQTCEKTTWLFIGQRNTTEPLFENGKFHQAARNKPDRLNVTANCSLVIKVSVEDVGLYTCRQFDASGRHQGSDSDVYLSVVNISEQKNSDETILICFLLTYGGCSHTVKWLYDNKDAENIKINPPQSACSAS
ncbi:hypothetical protein ILYODFUR_034818, partial [Ilyodon furcidens]